MTDETIFANALEKPDAAERSAYLDTACKDDPAQRKRIDGLIAAHEKAVGFLERPAAAPPAPEHAPTRAYPTHGRAVGDGPTRTHGEDAEEDTRDALAFLEPARRPDSIGRLGHYEVLEVLGRGAFGIVYRAFDEVLQRIVAVKVLSPSMAATSPARKRFLREAQSSAKVRHQNVVFIHETGEAPLPYLVMEFVPGETLQARLDRKGPLEVPEVVRIGRQIAEGLAAAHEQGLIHRDIKPSNILIDSGPQQVKITDFGLARAADDASLTRSGVVAGTPMYMAPEQAKGETLDHRADLFSLGSVMYAMLTGRPPFRAESMLAVLKRVAEDTPRPMREVIPEIPEWLCRIVDKLHAKDPAERYQSAKEVAEVLADCERQLQTHRELKDFGRIPEGKPSEVAPRRLPAALLFFCVAVVIAGIVGVQKGAFGPAEFVLLIVCLIALLIPAWVRAQRDAGEKGRPAPSRASVPTWSVGAYSAAVACAALGAFAVAIIWFPYKVDDVAPWLIGTLTLAALAPMVSAWLSGGRVPEAQGAAQRGERRHLLAGATGLVLGVGLPLLVLTGLALVAINPTVYRYATNRGELILEDMDPNMEVTILQHGVTVHDRSKQTSFELPANPSTEIRVFARGGAEVWRKDFAIKRGGRVTINLAEEQAAVEARHRATVSNNLKNIGEALHNFPFEFQPFLEGEGFVSLFNHTNLTGWKRDPKRPGTWGVEGSELVGRDGLTHLFSERDDYENFHLVVQAKVSGGAAVYFRAVNAGELPTGRVVELPTGKLFRATPLWEEAAPGAARVPEGKWFTLEVIAAGSQITTKVDGKICSDYRDDQPGAKRGQLVLHAHVGAEVRFRTIGVKELPATPPTPEERARAEAAKLNGEWVVRQGRVDQELLPGQDIAGMKLSLADGKFLMPIRDDSGYPWALTGIYTIDAEKKQLAFKFSRERLDTPPVVCTYRVEGDSLILDFPEPKVGNGETGSTELFARDERSATQRNLKNLGIAMHNYHSALETFPPAAITDPKAKDRKPLLSWRVALLPYLEQYPLYKQFKLDEPWDSEHNKKLIEKMPKIFAIPGTAAPAGHTHYRVFVGPGTAFEPRPAGAKELGLLDFLDGSSNTILVAEAADPVIWTKPDELPYDPKKPLPKLGVYKDGAHLLMGDGSVWRLSPQATETGIRGAIVRNDGEAISDQHLRRIPWRGPAVHLEFRRAAPPQALTALDREDLAKLRGEWLVRAAEKDGNALPQKDVATLVVRFSDGEFAIEQPGSTAQKETGPFRIDAANKLLFLDFKHSTVPVRCGYHIDGDLLQLTFGNWDSKKQVQTIDLATLRDRARTINYLKQLAIAMHNYNDELGGFPRAALTSAKDGKPLLSWRVAILPWVQQDELYKQFRLTEPWDSEHNKKLIEKMPKIFAPPAGATAQTGMTHYRVFTGPGTPFEAIPNRDFGVQLTQILDGTANTLLIVEATDPVVWTKPDDLPYDPKQPLPKLGATKVGIPVAMCDGSVRTLAPDVSEKALRALVTRNGGEMVPAPFLTPDPLETPPMYLECVRRAAVSDKDRLQGVWVGESGETLGQPLAAEKVAQMRMEFAGATLRVTEPGKPLQEGTFKLDPDANPKEIDAIRNADDQVSRGIYQFDGDKLIVCMGEPGPKRPRQFRTGPDTGPVLLVKFRRASPPPAAKPDPAVLQPLRDAVAAKARDVVLVKARLEAGTVSKIEVAVAEAELAEARIKLAEAEGDTVAVILYLQEVVKQRQEERNLIAFRVDAGRDRADVLNQADTRLAEAKARLAKVKPPPIPEIAPAPRRKS